MMTSMERMYAGGPLASRSFNSTFSTFSSSRFLM
jgi:hypothetical protein